MLKLLTMIAGFVVSVFSFFVALLSRKAIVVAAVIAAFLVAVLAFLAAINAVISSLSAMIVIPDWVSSYIGMFVPSNYAGVLSLILAAHTIKAAYNLAKEKIALIGQSN